MRVVKIVAEVGPRVGEHYGTGWAVPFRSADAAPQQFQVSSLYSDRSIPPGTVCLVGTVGTHEVIVSPDLPGGDA